ncbi:uncharacterized protein BX663DRAFT_576921 [Cokeromyces recurvatus]|uniref:uncharacterized protein n=1 Tax=Cokeromyces recurvatus TaxID=90255 RepID=UPI002220D8CE|nr:uncharacterized protein BX663DRAFT_576921 [Cokeromyces recurvatus]KAI7899592.1 hypothetical protein BX663DRAFT_576921 [Cokeromyces recurvatus]
MSNFLNKSIFYGQVNFTINLKRERSPSPDLSEGSISSADVKRTIKIKYFLGGGSKEWKPKEELLVKNINITEALKRFRKKSIGEADEGNNINCLRILSFSHIFPLNKFDDKKCVTRYFYGSTRKALRSIASRMKPRFERTPAKAVVYCKNEADKEEKEEKEENEENEENEVKEDMMSMVKYLVRHESQFHACVANTSKASFTEKHLMPVIRRVLLQDASKDILYAIIDKPNKDGKKPDFMIGTKVKSKELYFFFVEVKRPETTSKYQPEDDYAKLMKQMKGSVDEQLCLGVQNPSSLGLLVEGFDCTLFQMMLLADGVYMPMAINRFSLIEQSHHLVHLPSIVEAFYFVKVLIANKLTIATVY